MTDIIQSVEQFTQAVGCTTDRYNVRQTALYIGLQLEEMAEKLEEALQADTECSRQLHLASKMFKEGKFDHRVEAADRAAMLDADVDLALVTIGSMFSQGADVRGACGEVARANMSKLVKCNGVNDQGCFNGREYTNDTSKPPICKRCNGLGLVAIKDENGKVVKPKDFVPPNIEPFVCKEAE